MPHLTTFERIRVIDLFNNFPVETKCKFEVVAHVKYLKLNEEHEFDEPEA
jgi:hypothetical protein